MYKDDRSGCPISTSLEIFGDRWTLVILRDMVTGKKRFSEFLRSPEGITTNILTNRLELIERHGIAVKRAYQDRPKRCEFVLTDKGKALLPVLQEICRWGNRFYPGTWTPPAWFMERRVE